FRGGGHTHPVPFNCVARTSSGCDFEELNQEDCDGTWSNVCVVPARNNLRVCVVQKKFS
ncbi:hypothetical protein CpipJ_CPIJ009813, partial [Culex quinquefasciatus]